MKGAWHKPTKPRGMQVNLSSGGRKAWLVRDAAARVLRPKVREQVARATLLLARGAADTNAGGGRGLKSQDPPEDK